MLRLWWQQPSKQTKSECSALRPDKRGACNMLCSLCVCVRERKTQTPTRTRTQTWEQHESRGRRERQTDYLFSAAFLCLLYFRYFCLPPLPFFPLSFSFFCIQSLSAVSLSTSCTDCPAGTCHMNDEYSHTPAHSQDIHIDKVLTVRAVGRRFCMNLIWNSLQKKSRVESGEWGVGSHCLSTAVITAYTAYQKSI